MNNKKRIIGFAGRKRSGKGVLSNLLKEKEKAVVITIASYLKKLCCELLNISLEELNEKKDNGFTFDIVPDEKWFKIINKETNIDITLIKKSIQNKHITNIRELLQVIGTDVIRKFDENWHVNKMIEEIETYSDNTLIVIDDVRFINEYKAILNMCGEVFFIIRPNTLFISNHISELSLVWQNFDTQHIIINDYNTTEELKNVFFENYKTGFKNKPNYFSKTYMQCSDFGYNTDENDELLQDILRQNKTNKVFNEFGIIKYETCSKYLAKQYIEKVDNKIKYIDNRCNKFITYNPLITENLKKYV